MLKELAKGLFRVDDLLSTQDCLLLQQVMRSVWRESTGEEREQHGVGSSQWLAPQVAEIGSIVHVYPMLSGVVPAIAGAVELPVAHAHPLLGLKYGEGSFTRNREGRAPPTGDGAQWSVFVFLTGGKGNRLRFPQAGVDVPAHPGSAVLVERVDAEGRQRPELDLDVLESTGVTLLSMDLEPEPVSEDDAEPVFNEDWRSWIAENRERGCTPHSMLQAMVRKNHRYADCIRELGYTPRFPGALQIPNALWRGQPDVDLYEVDHLLSRDECTELIQAIKERASESTVTDGASYQVDASHRSGRSARFDRATCAGSFIDAIELRIANAMGIPIEYSEEIQGHWYRKGEFFKPHWDAFMPGSPEYQGHAGDRGQRTWTVLVFLNHNYSGGDTVFTELDRSFRPSAGRALVWSNLTEFGDVDRKTKHEGQPVQRGSKYILTKWFRERPQPVWERHPPKIGEGGDG